MGLVAFLGEALAISLSGVIAPGPMTAVTAERGAKSPYAGVLIALGHGLVEVPLMIGILFGLGRLFEIPEVGVAIGLAGSAFLIWMGVGMLRNLAPTAAERGAARRSSLLTGAALSAGNPYFLVWWATVGATLVSRSSIHGALGFILFAVGHWLCDLVWCSVVAYVSYRGRKLVGGRFGQAVSLVCAIALLGFGIRFAYDAAWGIHRLVTGG
jgi:threonine/homoserine/homoserine lactone efflux protein